MSTSALLPIPSPLDDYTVVTAWFENASELDVARWALQTGASGIRRDVIHVARFAFYYLSRSLAVRAFTDRVYLCPRLLLYRRWLTASSSLPPRS